MIPSGTIIVCPKCKGRIGKTVAALNMGDFLKADHVEMLIPVKNGDNTLSPCCLKPWFFSGSLSTSSGWMPPQPLEAEPE